MSDTPSSTRPKSPNAQDNTARTVHILRTGVANIASVCAGFRRLNADPVLTETAEDVTNARALVVPGVGAMGATMQQLETLGVIDALRARLDADRPTLCVCMGHQLLGAQSEESLGVSGLHIHEGVARRFPDGAGVRVPQLGWNAVRSPGSDARFLTEDGFAYFANSYRFTNLQTFADAGWRSATADYAGPFVAALERGNTLTCQFHPELSGAWGLALLGRWLDTAFGGANTNSRPTNTPADRFDIGVGGGGLRVRIIPCLDFRGGRVVKGVKFQNLRDAGDPAQLGGAYEAQGADELVMLDVSATTEERANAIETVQQVRETLSIPLTVGGGVRTADDAGRLLDAGADKTAVNTAAVTDPAIVSAIADRYGRQCAVVAIDAARTLDARDDEHAWEVVTRSGTNRTGIDAIGWARECAERGAGEVLLTSWDRDGTRSGYDTELLGAVSNAVSIPVIASGGAHSPAHLVEAIDAGADAVLAASIFHDGDWTVDAIKAELAQRGVNVRPFTPDKLGARKGQEVHA